MLCRLDAIDTVRDPSYVELGSLTTEVGMSEEIGDAKREPHCPNCGAKAKCHGEDVAAIDYYDYFVVWCESCGHVKASGNYGGWAGMPSQYNACPHCGVEANSHGEEIPDDVRQLTVIGVYREGILRQGKKSSSLATASQ